MVMANCRDHLFYGDTLHLAPYWAPCLYWLPPDLRCAPLHSTHRANIWLAVAHVCSAAKRALDILKHYDEGFTPPTAIAATRYAATLLATGNPQEAQVRGGGGAGGGKKDGVGGGRSSRGGVSHG